MTVCVFFKRSFCFIFCYYLVWTLVQLQTILCNRLFTQTLSSLKPSIFYINVFSQTSSMVSFDVLGYFCICFHILFYFCCVENRGRSYRSMRRIDNHGTVSGKCWLSLYLMNWFFYPQREGSFPYTAFFCWSLMYMEKNKLHTVLNQSKEISFLTVRLEVNQGFHMSPGPAAH